VTRWTLESTIFAAATVLQPALRAIVRISGCRTRDAVARLFVPDDGDGGFRRSVRPGVLKVEGDVAVRAWLWTFPGPDSYTGEDMAEIHVPGSLALVQLIEGRLMREGLEPAERGEFTARAMLLGKLELTQAEAINALVQAENDAQIEAALTLLAGRLHRSLEDAYERLTNLVADVEANIDFSEEEIEQVSLPRAIERIDGLAGELDRLLATAIDAESLSSLPRVFLVGPANAGKSSLLNALTGVDRAICSAIPGTTRDMLTAVWRYESREVQLVDTAGLIAEAADAVTAKAVARTQRFLATADLHLLVFDATDDAERALALLEPLAIDRGRSVAVINKIDLVSPQRIAGFENRLAGRYDRAARTSVRSGEGLDRLAALVFEWLGQSCLSVSAGQFALNRRQRHAIGRARDALAATCGEARTLAAEGGGFGYEIIAAGLHEALRGLSELLGKDATDNVLDNIFSQFCIGK